MKLFGLYGASGFGREVMPLVRQQAGGDHEIVFIDDGEQASELNGHQVMSYATFVARGGQAKSVNVAIADGSIRRSLFAKCREDGLDITGIIHASAIVGDGCALGIGAILCANTILTGNVKIGEGFHANIYSYVAHDCVIGDFVTFAPSVHCNGNVVIEDGAYIGTGAILKQGRPGAPLVIGAGAVVGMGAVVTKNVAPGATVVGNPARPLER